MDPVLSESPPWLTARRTPCRKSSSTSAQYRPMAKASSAIQPPPSVLLRAASRGQEFVLDAAEYPEATGWADGIVESRGAG